MKTANQIEKRQTTGIRLDSAAFKGLQVFLESSGHSGESLNSAFGSLVVARGAQGAPGSPMSSQGLPGMSRGAPMGSQGFPGCQEEGRLT